MKVSKVCAGDTANFIRMCLVEGDDDAFVLGSTDGRLGLVSGGELRMLPRLGLPNNPITDIYNRHSRLFVNYEHQAGGISHAAVLEFSPTTATASTQSIMSRAVHPPFVLPCGLPEHVDLSPLVERVFVRFMDTVFAYVNNAALLDAYTGTQTPPSQEFLRDIEVRMGVDETLAYDFRRHLAAIAGDYLHRGTRLGRNSNPALGRALLAHVRERTDLRGSVLYSCSRGDIYCSLFDGNLAKLVAATIYTIVSHLGADGTPFLLELSPDIGTLTTQVRTEVRAFHTDQQPLALLDAAFSVAAVRSRLAVLQGNCLSVTGHDGAYRQGHVEGTKVRMDAEGRLGVVFTPYNRNVTVFNLETCSPIEVFDWGVSILDVTISTDGMCAHALTSDRSILTFDLDY